MDDYREPPRGRGDPPVPGPAGEFRDLGELTGEIRMPQYGLSVVPPPHAPRVSFDAGHAYALALRDGLNPPSSSGPTIVVAVADSEFGWSDGRQGERLVYVVRWDEVRWMPSGPALPEAVHREPVVGLMMTIIDASTGARLSTTRTAAAVTVRGDLDQTTPPY